MCDGNFIWNSKTVFIFCVFQFSLSNKRQEKKQQKWNGNGNGNRYWNKHWEKKRPTYYINTREIQFYLFMMWLLLLLMEMKLFFYSYFFFHAMPEDIYFHSPKKKKKFPLFPVFSVPFAFCRLKIAFEMQSKNGKPLLLLPLWLWAEEPECGSDGRRKKKEEEAEKKRFLCFWDRNIGLNDGMLLRIHIFMIQIFSEEVQKRFFFCSPLRFVPEKRKSHHFHSRDSDVYLDTTSSAIRFEYVWSSKQWKVTQIIHLPVVKNRNHT